MIRARKRKFHCNVGTFGGSRAADILSEFLNRDDNPKVCRQVGKIFHTTTACFKDLFFLKNKERLMSMVKDNVFKSIDNKQWPEIIKNLTKNCITTQYRKYLCYYGPRNTLS